jgi:quercetin dioxygenase-like cupin family protein
MLRTPDLVFVNASAVAPARAFDGLTRRVLAHNDRLMLVEHTLEAGTIFPRHSHPHDQLAYLLSGHIRVRCADRTFDVRGGDSWVVRGGIEHEIVAVERSVGLDVFTPARDDYLP